MIIKRAEEKAIAADSTTSGKVKETAIEMIENTPTGRETKIETSGELSKITVKSLSEEDISTIRETTIVTSGEKSKMAVRALSENDISTSREMPNEKGTTIETTIETTTETTIEIQVLQPKVFGGSREPFFKKVPWPPEAAINGKI